MADKQYTARFRLNNQGVPERMEPGDTGEVYLTVHHQLNASGYVEEEDALEDILQAQRVKGGKQWPASFWMKFL